MKIKINNCEWRVDFVTVNEEPEVWGCAKPQHLLIRIRKDLNREIVKTTILHELVHAYLFSYGFSKIDYDEKLLFSEEQICDFVSMNFSQLKTLYDKLYKYYLKVYNNK